MVYLVQRKGQAHDHQMRPLVLLRQLRRLHPSHTTAHATTYNCEYTPKSPNNIMAPRGWVHLITLNLGSYKYINKPRCAQLGPHKNCVFGVHNTFPSWYAWVPAICASGDKLKKLGSHPTGESFDPSSLSITAISDIASGLTLFHIEPRCPSQGSGFCFRLLDFRIPFLLRGINTLCKGRLEGRKPSLWNYSSGDWTNQ